MCHKKDYAIERNNFAILYDISMIISFKRLSYDVTWNVIKMFEQKNLAFSHINLNY